MGSPMCTAYCILQSLNYARMPADKVKEIKARADIHLHFCIELYDLQRKNNRYFLHEHPLTATSWKDPEMLKLIGKKDVHTTVMHMCQYGMECRRSDGTYGPVFKPTRWCTNSPALISRLSRKCTRDHPHVHLTGGRAAKAAIYPPALCLQILLGIRDQIRLNESLAAPETTSALSSSSPHQQPPPEPKKNHKIEDGEINLIDKITEHTKFYDEFTGLELDKALCIQARREELEFFVRKGVYNIVPQSEAWKNTGKPPISIRWTYTNKGDDASPEIRARLVAREIRQETSDGSMYAATPPLEMVKWLISKAASNPHLIGTPKELKLSFVDAKRAYFNARCEEDIYIELPHEHQQPGRCGKLKQWMYGTRGAASKWEDHYSQALSRMGFTRGRASPCTFTHNTRPLDCVVHGDDFTTLGPEEDLTWFESEISKAFEVKLRGRLGGGEKDMKEIRLLNRIVRRTSFGYEWEADPRHSEIIISSMGAEEANFVTTPGVHLKTVDIDQEEIPPHEATTYRALAARANFLSLDRGDIQFSAKEICRQMSKPRRCDWGKIKRLARYLKGAPRMVLSYPWQNMNNVITAVVDTDFAGCLETRKSTSGGIMMHGAHCLKSWSTTQSVIALSSGEAELYGITKGASMALGLQSALSDAGVTVKVEIYSDSAAARGE